MFDSLTDRLSRSFSFLKGKKELTEDNIQEGLKDVRAALLEADVHFQLARDFTDRVRERALGASRLKGVDASNQFVHAVHEELVEIMGPEDARLEFARTGPTVILMAGLQGAGKARGVMLWPLVSCCGNTPLPSFRKAERRTER